MMSRIIILHLLVIIASCSGVKFSFRYFEYALDEVDGSAVLSVEIQRIPENGEIASQEIVELTSGCPTDCPALSKVDLAIEGISADYTFSNPSFTASSNTARVPIVINDDTIHEMREYFCLRVTDEAQRGSQWYTRITIPWNDYCTRIVSGSKEPGFQGCGCMPGLAAGGFDEHQHFSVSYLAAYPGFDVMKSPRRGYVGPWNTDETVDIHVFSDDNEDLNIFLTEGVDYNTFEHYDLLIDDVSAAYHTASSLFEPEFTGGYSTKVFPESTLLTKNGPYGVPLGDFRPFDGHYLVADEVNSFTLSYTRQTGTISLTPTAPLVEASDLDPNGPLNIDNLFVDSALYNKANWEICGLGLDPKRIPIESVSASGEHEFYDLRTVYDDDPHSYLTDGACFVSGPDSNGHHWLQLDLGREFVVKNLVIYTINDNADPKIRGHGDFAMNAFLDNAHIYVGNCRSEDHGFKTSSIFSRLDHLCNDDIGVLAEMAMIQVNCISNAYGRYVYLIPSPNSGDPLTLCEIEVFGDEVPFVDSNGNPIESRVEFSSSTQSVTEGDGTVSLTLSRIGERETCTYVSYFTDMSYGDADITSVPLFDAKEVMFTKDDDSITIPIDITQDGMCEDVEKYNVKLHSIEGGRFGNQCWTTLEITDDDVSTSYALRLPSTTVNENDEEVVINIDRSGTSTLTSGRATLTFIESTATNTAASNDYGSAIQSVNFLASSATQTATVTIEDDQCYEDPETFSVSLTVNDPAICSSLGSPSVEQITITDNDSLFKWNTQESVILIREGGGPFEVGVIRQGTLQDKNIEFILGHITTDSNDFTITPSDNRVSFNAGSSFSSQVVSINANIDNEVEDNEVFILRLVDPLGSLCPNGNREHPYLLKFQILDNDGTYYWKDNTVSVAENQGQVSVCLLRGDQMNNAQTVEISSAGVTAISQVDFIPLNEISFEPEETETCISIPLIADTERESTESFTLTIVPGQVNVVVGSPNVATVRIIDSSDSEISWDAISYTFTEGTVATMRIVKIGSNAVDVVITPSPVSATSGFDFIPGSVTITVPADMEFFDFELNLPDDDIFEPTETFTLTLSKTSSGSILTAVTTINIIDNDVDNVVAAADPPTESNMPPQPVGDTTLSDGEIAGISTSAAVVGVVGVAGAIGVVFLVTRGSISAGSAATSAAINAAQLASNTAAPLGFASNGGYYVGNGLNNAAGGLPDGFSF